MYPPAQRAFLSDIEGGPFKIGVAEGNWDLADPSLLPSDLSWPRVVFWVTASPRGNSPGKFFIRLHCNNYPNDPPTGNFWDIKTNAPLAILKRPKGKDNVKMVFRTDWEQGRAFYHPYDSVAMKSHPDWKRKYPHLVWDSKHTIVDLLEEIHKLLNCDNYTGV